MFSNLLRDILNHELPSLSPVSIHLVKNSANVNYSKNQKSHYARTQCLGAKPNSQYMHSLHADFSECTVTKLAVHSILKSYAYLVVTNF